MSVKVAVVDRVVENLYGKAKKKRREAILHFFLI